MRENDTARGRRWAAFYEEEGGLRDMLALIRSTYVERMSDLEPWETDKLAKLAMAGKIAGQLDGLILSIINDGRIEEAATEHRRKIEALPARKRKLLGWE